jgi:hypothetical protein
MGPADLRSRLAAVGARPTEEELAALLPVLARRIASWELVERDDLGETPPSAAFRPLVVE